MKGFGGSRGFISGFSLSGPGFGEFLLLPFFFFAMSSKIKQARARGGPCSGVYLLVVTSFSILTTLKKQQI